MADAGAMPQANHDPIQEQIAALDDPEAREYAALLERLAFHMSSRIEYAEGRRSALATAGTAVLAGGIAILAITKDVPHIIQVGLAVLSAGFILTGILVLAVYAGQTNFSYGFIQPNVQVQRPWKWFYRDALQNSNEFTAPWHTRQSEAERQTTQAAYLNQWQPFAQRYLGLTDPHEDAMQNLRQVYLLHVNERYKNLFLTQLRKVFFRTLMAAVVAGTIAFAIAAMVATAPDAAPSPSPNVTTTSSATP